MKELTLEILEKALEDWRKPISMCQENHTNLGLCHYFNVVHNIKCYGFNRLTAPWYKYVAFYVWLYHFNGIGEEKQGRYERIQAIKGMIKDLKEKQNEDTNKS